MPTKTFYNLTKDKRLRIIKAGKAEFSRVELDKAIIANIAKDAGILRGSFYQYFTSTTDLFIHIIEYIYGFNKKKFILELEEVGDFFTVLKNRFSNEVTKLNKEENRQFRINIMTLLLRVEKEQSQLLSALIQKKDAISIDFFPEEIRKKKDFAKILSLINMVGDNCINRYLTLQIPEEEIKKDYNNYIDFVQSGFGKFL